MENGAPFEVSTRLDQRHARERLDRALQCLTAGSGRITHSRSAFGM